MKNINESKPIIRWTLGPSYNSIGFEVLFESIRSFKKNYGNNFNFVLCYNNINPPDIKNFIYLKQESLEELPAPCGVAWKLYPPRINLNCHEMFIDNDLVISKKINKINEFLKKTDTLICTEGLYYNYGNFNSLIKNKISLNSGFFGVPPYFDLKKKIIEKLKLVKLSNWEKYFDEQGLVSSLIIENKNIIISNKEIHICDKKYVKNKKGYHFVGLNNGNAHFWNLYKKSNKKFL